jgi:hypothetical protein
VGQNHVQNNNRKAHLYTKFMSIWYEIKDKEDINLSDDGKSLQINFDSDHNGNIWVEVPLELIDQLRQPAVMQRSEQLKAYTKWLRQNEHLQSAPFPSLIDQYLKSL